MITLTPGLEALRTQQTHYHAQLWKITRKDGVVKRFTDHNQKVTFQQMEYKPAGGIDSSNIRSEADLRENNLDVIGALNSSDITQSDLQAGRYDNARIDRYLVDHRYPFAGAFRHDVFNVVKIEEDGQAWKADMVGLTRRLEHKTGRVLSLGCDWKLGEGFGVSGTPGCKFDLDSKAYFSVSVVAVTSRTVFRLDSSDIPLGLTGSPGGDDYFGLGFVRWLTGNNQGLDTQIKSYSEESPDRQVTLILPAPLAIQVNDVCNIYPGCAGTTTVCSTKFSNLVNYGGNPFGPGTDKTRETP